MVFFSDKFWPSWAVIVGRQYRFKFKH